jgi:hypothetical protein
MTTITLVEDVGMATMADTMLVGSHWAKPRPSNEEAFS